MEISNRDKKMFAAAKAVAETSDFNGAHIGCVVSCGHNIISVASNSEKTHTLQKIYNKFRKFNSEIYPNKVHAEVHALSWLIGKDIDWSKIDIYIYREWKDGTPAVSKPCVSCYHLIQDLGIKQVCYVDNFGNFVKTSVDELGKDYQ